jgi:hypothetical protein
MGGHRGLPRRAMVRHANRRGNPLWLPRWLCGWRWWLGGHRGPPLRVMAWQIVGATPVVAPLAGLWGRSRLGGHRGPPRRVMVNAANRRGNPRGCPVGGCLRGWRSRLGRHRGPPLRVMVQRTIVGATPVVAPLAAVGGVRGWADTGVRPDGGDATGDGSNRVGAISCGCPAAQAGYLACSSDLRRRMSGISVGSTPLSSASQ